MIFFILWSYCVWLALVLTTLYAVKKSKFEDIGFFEKNFFAYESYVIRIAPAWHKISELIFSIFFGFNIVKSSLDIAAVVIIIFITRPSFITMGFNYRIFRG
jgi:hypothetical protein